MSAYPELRGTFDIDDKHVVDLQAFGDSIREEVHRSNEVMIRDAISPKYFTCVVVESADEKEKVIRAVSDAGLAPEGVVCGKRLDEFVVTSDQFLIAAEKQEATDPSVKREKVIKYRFSVPEQETCPID